MATQKPISSISYNSVSFLEEKLDCLYNAHIIQAYMFMFHKGEDGDKDHIHFRIEPNKKIDPMCLSEDFREYEKGSDKPLGIRPWRPSKEEDWILYAVHDPEYMAIKYPNDKKEKLPYDWKDIVASPFFDVETAYIRAKASLKHTSQNIAKRIQQGEDPLKIALEGENVFTINALNRLTQTTDYGRLSEQYTRLETSYNQLCECVLKSGFYCGIDENGQLKLVKASAEIKENWQNYSVFGLPKDIEV